MYNFFQLLCLNICIKPYKSSHYTCIQINTSQIYITFGISFGTSDLDFSSKFSSKKLSALRLSFWSSTEISFIVDSNFLAPSFWSDFSWVICLRNFSTVCHIWIADFSYHCVLYWVQKISHWTSSVVPGDTFSKIFGIAFPLSLYFPFKQNKSFL